MNNPPVFDEAFMIESFKGEQQTIMRLMAENSPHPIVKPWQLAHALSRCAHAARALRDGTMTLDDSLREYCEITAEMCEIELTLWRVQYREKRAQIKAFINDRIRDWYGHGWVILDNGVIDITPAGMKHVAQDMEMHGLEMR